MEQSQIERYGWIIVLMVMVDVGMVWAQSNDTPIADGSWHEEMVAFITDTATECRALPRHEYRDEYWNGARGEEEPEAITYTVREQEGITEPRPPDRWRDGSGRHEVPAVPGEVRGGQSSPHCSR